MGFNKSFIHNGWNDTWYREPAEADNVYTAMVNTTSATSVSLSVAF